VPGQPECVVASSVYLGVPALAGDIANEARWLPGPAVYPVAALRALAAWRPVTFRLTSAGPAREFAGYAVVIANSARFGAGMQVAPDALMDDGLLDIVTMRHGPKLAFLRVLLSIRDGGHVRLPLVSLDQGTAITLTTDRDTPAGADGEALPGVAPLPAGTPLTIRVLPAAVSVLTPP
jgi:diacylglycerol kinase (ATP)